MYANVRETGTEISWYGCDFREPTSEGRCLNDVCILAWLLRGTHKADNVLIRGAQKPIACDKGMSASK